MYFFWILLFCLNDLSLLLEKYALYGINQWQTNLTIISLFFWLLPEAKQLEILELYHIILLKRHVMRAPLKSFFLSFSNN